MTPSRYLRRSLIAAIVATSIAGGLLLFMRAPATSTAPKLSPTFGKLPVSFEANLGQSDPNVRFLSRRPGTSLFLTTREAVINSSTTHSGWVCIWINPTAGYMEAGISIKVVALIFRPIWDSISRRSVCPVCKSMRFPSTVREPGFMPSFTAREFFPHRLLDCRQEGDPAKSQVNNVLSSKPYEGRNHRLAGVRQVHNLSSFSPGKSSRFPVGSAASGSECDLRESSGYPAGQTL